MENFATIRMELDLQAQRVIHQYMVDNAKISEEVTRGIKEAFDSFDIAEAIRKEVSHCLQEAVRGSGNWSTLRATIQKKMDIVVEEHIEKTLESLKESLKTL